MCLVRILKRNAKTLLLLTVFITLSSVSPSASNAKEIFKARQRSAIAVKKLPAGYKVAHVGRQKYFVHNGTFYQKRAGAYIAVKAPIGAVVPVLPVGFSTVIIRGATFYIAADVYYRLTPEGFIVVVPPEIESPGSVKVGKQEQVAVQVPLLNVRSGPGTEHAVLMQVQKGEVLMVEGTAPGWYYVHLPDENYGWVMRRFTLPIKPLPQG